MLWGLIPITAGFNFAVFFLMIMHLVFWLVMIGFLADGVEKKILEQINDIINNTTKGK